MAEINTEAIEQAFAALGDTLVKAIKGDGGGKDDKPDPDKAAPEEAKKLASDVAGLTETVSKIGEAVTSLTALFKAGREPSGDEDKGEPAGEVMAAIKAVAEMQEAIQTHGEAIEKVADRLEKLEDRAAIRKSIDGQDGGDGEGDVSKSKFGGAGIALANGRSIVLK